LQLTEHFSLEELTHSDIGTRKGIDNTPDVDAVENLKVLARTMEQIRGLLGHPIHVNSGYRGPKLNSAVGGSKTSAHMEGLAADFVCPSFGTPKEIAVEIAASDIAFDQLIEEGTWVHISVDPRMRRQVLTATFSNGKASYSPLAA
jgi:hypothetical protein